MPLTFSTDRFFQPARSLGTSFSFPVEKRTVWSRCGMIDVFSAGSGDAVLILPGLAGGSKLLQPLVESLATTNRVFWFDWAGEGRSFALEALRLKEHPTRLLADVIDSLPVESVAVFGVSYGGCVALDLARHCNLKMNHLIVTGTPDRLEHAWASRLVHKILTRVPLRSDSAFLNQFFRILLGDGVRDGDVEQFVIDCVWQTDQALMARRLDWLLDFDLSASIRDIQIPTTVLTGDRDIVVPPVCQERLANTLAEADMHVIRGAGHLGFLTHTDEYCRLIRKALTGSMQLAS